MATWGKVIGTGLVVGGLATLGIGAFGEAGAQALGTSAAEGAAAAGTETAAAAAAEGATAAEGVAATTTTAAEGANVAAETAAAGETPLGTKIGDALQTTTDKVQGVAKDVTNVAGLDMSEKASALTLGGVTTAAGVGILATSGGKSDEDSAREKAEEEIKAIRKRMLAMEQEHGIDLDGDGHIGRTPPGSDRGGPGGHGLA
ncbi:MAG: hypothetical protein AB7L92_05165 [Alphaproteobacteria bacterium]